MTQSPHYAQPTGAPLHHCRNGLCYTFMFTMLLFSLLLGACSSEPTLDVSNLQTFKASIQDMQYKQPAQKQYKIKQAVTVLGLANLDPSLPLGMDMDEYDGMTADELIEAAEELVKNK